MTFSLRARTAARSIVGWAKRDAPVGQVLGFGDRLGHVQQGLRGDAAAQQADAAQARFEIDQGDLQAQIGGEKRGGISAGTGAEDAELGVHGRDWVRDWDCSRSRLLLVLQPLSLTSSAAVYQAIADSQSRR